MNKSAIILLFLLLPAISLAQGIMIPNDVDESVTRYYYNVKRSTPVLNRIFCDSVAAEEMADSFYTHLERPHFVHPYAGHDSALFVMHEAILDRSPLRKAPYAGLGDGLRGFWYLFSKVYLGHIYDKDGNQRDDLKDRLDSTYTKLAGWYDGYVVAYIAPAYYMGFRLSPCPLLIRFAGGEWVHSESFFGPADYFSTLGSTSLDGEWTGSVTTSAFHLGLELTRAGCHPLSKLPARDTSVTFSVLLYDTGNGNYDLRLLLPLQPEESERRIFDELRWYVTRLRPNLFQPCYTTDHRLMTGRYYRVTFDKRGWWIEDYLDFYRKEYIGS
ncbi:MAG: DUF5030 domain-containing protein [Bacteroidaceae bacterium]|nr:DUF5030 domain-containing protein [Bacteroidaceae bacterium]